jgi:putative transposase
LHPRGLPLPECWVPGPARPSRDRLRSTSRPGRCQDNAVAESFFHTLKAEWIHHFDFATREEARLAVFDYVGGFYHPSRLHATLRYRPPGEYEKMSSAA